MTAEQAESLQRFLADEDQLVARLRALGWSQTRALRLLGIAASSWHYRHHPRPPVAAPVAHAARTGSHWLSDVETAAVITKLMAAFEDGTSVFEAYYQALDAGDPVASLSSWYRIARAYLEPCRPFRPRKNKRCSAMPQWSADAPMQVWSWDITMLPGRYRRLNYCFYAVIDVFSRKIVAWRVEEREDDELAKDMFETGFAAEQGHPMVVHADGGPSMKSITVAELFMTLGITRSHNRPRVSNDNPYSESLFKTTKTRPDLPKFFDSLQHAQQWVAAFVDWYNTQHRHSSLEGHTPASVHDGSWVQIHQQRQAVLDELYQANPGRYSKPPTVKTPMALVVLNQKKPEDRLQTG